MFTYLFNAKLPVEDHITLDLSDLIEWHFLGFDSDANAYWKAQLRDGETDIIIVLTRYGEILDCFQNNLSFRSIPAVAPNGDVYFMDYNYTGDDYIHFYKVERRW